MHSPRMMNHSLHATSRYRHRGKPGTDPVFPRPIFWKNFNHKGEINFFFKTCYFLENFDAEKTNADACPRILKYKKQKSEKK
jgi:hypothetical protein